MPTGFTKNSLSTPPRQPLSLKGAQLSRLLCLAVLTIFHHGLSLSQATQATTQAASLPNNPLASDTSVAVVLGPLGHMDAAALSELSAHFAAVGGTPWLGFQGTGSISYGMGASPTFPATMYNLGADSFRLDVQTSKGMVSTRISKWVGSLQGSDETINSIDPDTAAAGIFPFEHVMVAPASGISLIDQGMVSINGLSLHRITQAHAAFGHKSSDVGALALATDFYFDPTSHLLVRSARTVTITGTPRVRFRLVVTYSDYRLVGTTLIPFRYVETIDGQQSRVLQLTSAQLSTALNPNDFEF